MKTIQTSILFLTTLLFSIGCVKENLDDCPDDPDYNLVLLFEYTDQDANDVLTERISGMDVAIFDKDRNLYEWLNADDALQDPEKSKRIHVDPGTYYILSWANDVSFRQNRMLVPEDPDLEHAYMYNSFSTTSADQLHYAPDLRQLEENENPEDLRLYQVEVAPEGITRHTLSYMGAYRTVNVYLRGFDEIYSGRPDNISVAITHLARYYDSFLHHEEEDLQYQINATEVTENEETFGFAGFYVPHFDNESHVTVEIDGDRDSGEHYHFSITMNDILKKLEMYLVDGDLETIPVIIEFKGTYVEIKVPEWLVIEVDPGYN